MFVPMVSRTLWENAGKSSRESSCDYSSPTDPARPPEPERSASSSWQNAAFLVREIVRADETKNRMPAYRLPTARSCEELAEAPIHHHRPTQWGRRDRNCLASQSDLHDDTLGNGRLELELADRIRRYPVSETQQFAVDGLVARGRIVRHHRHGQRHEVMPREWQADCRRATGAAHRA